MHRPSIGGAFAAALLLTATGTALAAPPSPTATTPELLAKAKDEKKIVWYTSIELQTAEKIAKEFETVPRSTVDWDTSQADDFRTRGEPWTIKRTVLERGRVPRSERKSLAR
jgi:hypothetical protein